MVAASAGPSLLPLALPGAQRLLLLLALCAYRTQCGEPHTAGILRAAGPRFAEGSTEDGGLIS
jgi:hypothetical protein